MTHKTKLITPHGGVLIWNYNDRMGASPHGNVNEIDQIFINTTSLISVTTNKNKSTPAGNFEFRLAPNYNWVARITPGSWCVILMSQNKPIPQIDPDNVGFADPDLVKMLGRIDSVRAVVEVDQETGARRTMYVVTGQDWCSVFDTKLYIDPIVRNNNLEKLTAIGQSTRIAFDNFITSWVDDKTNVLPSSSQVVSALIDLWGAPLLDISTSVGALSGSPGIQLDKNPIFSSEAQFQIPTKVAQYMGFGGLLGGVTGGSINFSKIISRYDGTLKSYDTYSGDNKEALGFPDPASFFKVNSFWQMLVDNCNPVINELVTDLRWEADGSAKLALYKRVKPFLNRSAFEKSDAPEVIKNTSKFSNVRRIEIPTEDVVAINAGTNWRDKINFIEIRPQPQLNATNFENAVKLDSQVIDRTAYERDGFKPLIQSVQYMPFDGSQPAPLKCLEWKYLLKEWYFNTHLMLNGSITIIGQNQYIQVGDNIMVDAGVLGSGILNIKQYDKTTYLLAHVEGVSHNFGVNSETGARSFSTTIRFVRGVITNKNGQIIGSDQLEGAIDMKAQAIGGGEEKNKNVVYNSTITDPEHVKGH
jgi:hypothetical protein